MKECDYIWNRAMFVHKFLMVALGLLRIPCFESLCESNKDFLLFFGLMVTKVMGVVFKKLEID